MYTLVRDNIPDLVKGSKQIINYAAIANDEFYVLGLKQKMVEDVNGFLGSKEVVDINKLADLKLVVDTLVGLFGKEEEFKKVYANKLATDGAYIKRYIAFFDDVQKDSEPATKE